MLAVPVPDGQQFRVVQIVKGDAVVDTNRSTAWM